MKYVRSNKLYGFTLIELMIVVVVIGIIVAFGYPIYTEKMIETRRSDAKDALSRLATLQEKFFTECNQYATTLTDTVTGSACGGGVGGGAPRIAWDLVANMPTATTGLSADGHYVVSIINPPPAGPLNTCTAAICFLLEANPSIAGASGLQRKGVIWDGEFRLDHTGRKSWDKSDTTAVNPITGMFAKKWSDK